MLRLKLKMRDYKIEVIQSYIKNNNEKAIYRYSWNKDVLHSYNELIFCYACQYGNINIIKFLLSLKDKCEKINIHKNKEMALRLACKHGHMDVVKFLFSLQKEYGNFNVTYKIFKDICSYGHVEILKYIVTSTQMDSNINNYLRKACINEHIDVAKYLISFINVSNYYIYNTFRYLCLRGKNIKILKLLYENLDDEHLNLLSNCKLFDKELQLYLKDKNVAKFLLSISDKLNESCIDIIKSKL